VVSDQPAGPGARPAAVQGQPAAGPQQPRRPRRISRRTQITCIAAALAIAALAVVSLAGTGAGGGPRTRPVARNFSLAALGQPGRRVSLAAFAGRPVIINFFASWCVPCKRETPTMAGFFRQSGGRVEIIGVDSNDEAGPATRFVRAAGVRYPVGVDPFPASTTTSYGVLALPQTFFLNAQHRIVRRIYGAVTLKQLSEGVAAMDKGWRPGAQAAGQAAG
jgi:cytochrome c biogenesis protein CcmG/thiol:disulfide interchange protein DsbE